MRPAVKSAATPLWLPIPDHDHDGDNPDGRLLNDDEDDSPDMDIPLHSVSPWPKRALKSPMMTLPILLLPKYVIFIAHADGGNRSLSEYLVLAADENSKDSPFCTWLRS